MQNPELKAKIIKFGNEITHSISKVIDLSSFTKNTDSKGSDKK